MSDTPTPRTDEAQRNTPVGYVLATVAERLERELAKANAGFSAVTDANVQLILERDKAVEELTTLNSLYDSLNLAKLKAEAERDAALAKCAELRHALLCANNSFVGSPGGQHQIDKALSVECGSSFIHKDAKEICALVAFVEDSEDCSVRNKVLDAARAAGLGKIQ